MTRFLHNLFSRPAPLLPARPPAGGQACGLPPAPPPAASEAHCFHCGLPLPREGAEWVTFDGARRPVCCTACRAIVGLVLAHDLGDYYRERDRRACPA